MRVEGKGTCDLWVEDKPQTKNSYEYPKAIKKRAMGLPATLAKALGKPLFE